MEGDRKELIVTHLFCSGHLPTLLRHSSFELIPSVTPAPYPDSDWISNFWYQDGLSRLWYLSPRMPLLLFFQIRQETKRDDLPGTRTDFTLILWQCELVSCLVAFSNNKVLGWYLFFYLSVPSSIPLFLPLHFLSFTNLLLVGVTEASDR